MGLEEHATGVVNVTAEELRAYMREHGENDYLLLDVRQPQEYVAAHLPGAWLIPLMEIESRVDDIRIASDKLTIVYCQSGGRSARAAGYLAQAAGMPNVFNLIGGMSGWTGQRLPHFPNVRAFDETASPSEVLVQAMNLEKGADRLYASLLEHFRGTEAGETIERLAKAEEGHGRAVYGAFEKLGQEHLEDFDMLYARLEGDVLESGATFEDALEVARAAAAQGTIPLLELALGIELKAYDLYRSLAHSSTDDALRKTFVHLAEQEKRHARSLTYAIGKAAA